MLSYRHAFHAGNAADVLKHSVLIQCLEYMRQKEKGFTYIDTHAGAGLYHLDEGYAAQNKEWFSGTGKVIDKINLINLVNPIDKIDRTELLCASFEKSEPRLLNRYREIISPFWQSAKRYPGSCVIAAQILRSQDKAFCYELHPRDFELLHTQLENDRRFKIIKSDGPKDFVSLLPPLTRRACILIDPSYEMKTDYINLPKYISAALKRFANGIYIIWYPLLTRKDVREITMEFPSSLMNFYDGNRCRIEIQFSEILPEERGMYGCGLVIYNPPWVLKEILEYDIPRLANLLNGTFSLQWEA